MQRSRLMFTYAIRFVEVVMFVVMIVAIITWVLYAVVLWHTIYHEMKGDAIRCDEPNSFRWDEILWFYAIASVGLKYVNVSYALPSALCPLPAARCPLPAARCPLPSALWV